MNVNNWLEFISDKNALKILFYLREFSSVASFNELEKNLGLSEKVH